MNDERGGSSGEICWRSDDVDHRHVLFNVILFRPHVLSGNSRCHFCSWSKPFKCLLNSTCHFPGTQSANDAAESSQVGFSPAALDTTGQFEPGAERNGVWLWNLGDCLGRSTTRSVQIRTATSEYKTLRFHWYLRSTSESAVQHCYAPSRNTRFVVTVTTENCSSTADERKNDDAGSRGFLRGVD